MEDNEPTANEITDWLIQIALDEIINGDEPAVAES